MLLFMGMFMGGACGAQNLIHIENKSKTKIFITFGDTVPYLGKNLDCILQDDAGNYWFASNGDGVFKYDGRVLTQFTTKHGLCSDFVLKIQKDINGKLWFSTSHGFCCFDGATFKDYTDAILDAPTKKLETPNGSIIFGQRNGVCLYDGKSFSEFVIHPNDYKPSASDLNRPFSVYSSLIDDSGNVWFGTQSEGVCRYDGHDFTYLTEKNLAGYAVRTIFQDKKGHLWFGNNGGGLFRWDGKTLTNITDERPSMMMLMATFGSEQSMLVYGNTME